MKSRRDTESGIHIAIFHLPEDRQIRVGRLGLLHLQRGVYFYVGSAQRSLSARIERHRRRKKPRRWHIDCLSVKSKMLGAIIVPGPREHECKVAKKVGRMFELAAPGFGASDCRCGGHLFYASQFE